MSELDNYLNQRILDFVDKPRVIEMSPETLAYIKRQARRRKIFSQYPWAIDLYKSLNDRIQDMQKSAAKIDLGGISSRMTANQAREYLPEALSIEPRILDNPYTKGTWFGGLHKDDKKAQMYKDLLYEIEQQYPEELRDVTVHLGGRRLLSDLWRGFTNKRLGDEWRKHRIRNLWRWLQGSNRDNLSRGTLYSGTTNTVTLYHDDPATLIHELGHAIDMNSRKNLPEYAYSTDDVTKERNANRAGSDSIAKAFADDPNILSILQTLQLRAHPTAVFDYARPGLPKSFIDNLDIREVARYGNIDHDKILDEHINLPSSELINRLQVALEKRRKLRESK